MAKQIVARHNVCAAKEYTTSQGEVKTQWVNLGTSVTFDDGSYLININALPTGSWWDGTLQCFKQEPRDQQGTARPQSSPAGGYQQPQYGQAPQGYQRSAPVAPPVAASYPTYEDSPF